MRFGFESGRVPNGRQLRDFIRVLAKKSGSPPQLCVWALENLAMNLGLLKFGRSQGQKFSTSKETLAAVRPLMEQPSSGVKIRTNPAGEIKVTLDGKSSFTLPAGTAPSAIADKIDDALFHRAVNRAAQQRTRPPFGW
jgi:hypothetical protein